MLWVVLDPAIDVQKLNRQLTPEGIQIAAGSIFSATGKFRNCMRLNYATPVSPEIERAVRRVGALAQAAMAEASVPSTTAQALPA